MLLVSLLKVLLLNSLEPKSKNCFSILGQKKLSGQKTFDVECEKEEICLKYVDSITTVIQNYKNLMNKEIETNNLMKSSNLEKRNSQI